MKIAVACLGENVSEHFGHCEHFRFYTLENGKIIKEEAVLNPGHGHGSLPNFIVENGAGVVISGGMGNGALSGLQARNIEVVLGGKGKAEFAVNEYINGRLKSVDSACCNHGHDGHHEHGHGHTCQCSTHHKCS